MAAARTTTLALAFGSLCLTTGLALGYPNPPPEVLAWRGMRLNEKGQAQFISLDERLPSKKNWTSNSNPRVIGPVPNIHQCGAGSLAYPISYLLTAANAINTGTFVQLSTAELIACTGDGCDGGFAGPMLNWTVNHGLTSAKKWPMSNKIPTCKAAVPVAKAIATFQIPTHSERDMAKFVAFYGPVFATFDALEWEHYTGGIFSQKNCGNQLDQGALVVGYDMIHNPPYWIIQNNWGPAWGEGGYIRMKMGVDECGISDSAWALV